MKSIAVVIPAYNEADHIDRNLTEIIVHTQHIEGLRFVLIVVNDGSSDATAEIVLRRANESIRLLCLNRHFGKEAAIYAGLLHCRDFDAVIVMDSDLQHPPSLITEMVQRWQQGSHVVEAVKRYRGEEPLAKDVLVRAYFRLFNLFTNLSVNGDTDFKLLDAVVVKAYCDLPEHHRFFRGLIRWMNFTTEQIPFDVPESARSASKWRKAALFRYAISSITSFTALPLQIVTMLGGATFLISIVIGGMALFDRMMGNAVDGFTTVIVLILLIGSILMFSVGLIGTYLGRIYDEVKRRPSFLVNRSRSNVDDLV